MEIKDTAMIQSKQAQKVAELKRINLLARVDRSELVKFFQNKSGFSSLPGYAEDVIKSRESRIVNNPKGWVIPAECYGRKAAGGPTPTMRETIRQWIAKHLTQYIPEGSKVMVAFEDWHEDGPRVVIYRKVWK
jgi:hypothetical protein